MDKEYARKLSLKVIRDYTLVSSNFSRARSRTWPEIDSLINQYVKEKDRVLDLGCGNGRFSVPVLGKKALYFGIDNSEQLIAIAKKKYPQVSFNVADALDIPFSKDEFNVILSVSLLHHVPSQFLRDRVIKECQRVLKPGGFLVLTVWNLWNSPQKRKKIFKNVFMKILGKSKLDFKDILVDWYGAKNCYVHCFTKKELIRIVEKNDFKIISSGVINLENKKSLSNLLIVAQKISG
jgi:ubiquinone/menaquinone biosynthesis C-methylase UbiE